MPVPARILVTGLLLAAVACGRDPASTLDGATRETAPADVEATRVAEGVRVVNHTSQGIAYAVWNPQFLGLMGVCEDPGPPCVRLAPGGSVVVPESEFVGWAPTPGDAPSALPRALELRWWHVAADGAGGYRASEVRVVPRGP
jgi:hypothetical protein